MKISGLVEAHGATTDLDLEPHAAGRDLVDGLDDGDAAALATVRDRRVSTSLAGGATVSSSTSASGTSAIDRRSVANDDDRSSRGQVGRRRGLDRRGRGRGRRGIAQQVADRILRRGLSILRRVLQSTRHHGPGAHQA